MLACVRATGPCAAVFKSEQIRDCVLPHSNRVKKSELTPKHLSSVACPTCGVAAGQRCLRYSGAPRSEPHLDRKLAAFDLTTEGQLTAQ